MTGHRGSTSLQGAVDWTKFAQPAGDSRMDLQGVHRHLSRPARRRGRSRPRVGRWPHCCRGGDAGIACRALPPWSAPADWRKPSRHLSAGRSGRVRPRAAVGHRQRRDADGFGDGAAAPAWCGVRGDHEPGVPGPPQPRRRSAERRAQDRRELSERRCRRDLGPRTAFALGRARDAAGSRTTVARCARRCASGRSGLGRDDGPSSTTWPTTWRPTRTVVTRGRIAAMWRRCCAGWPTGISRCWAINAVQSATDACRARTRPPASVCCAGARAPVLV